MLHFYKILFSLFMQSKFSAKHSNMDVIQQRLIYNPVKHSLYLSAIYKVNFINGRQFYRTLLTAMCPIIKPMPLQFPSFIVLEYSSQS